MRVRRNGPTPLVICPIKCPQHRPPALHHVAERFYPLGRRRFPPPHVHEVKPKLTIQPQHYMHGVISAFLAAHREVRSAIQPQPRRQRDVERRDDPVLAEILTHHRRQREGARWRRGPADAGSTILGLPECKWLTM